MIFGTRPEAIKLAPLVRALARRGLPSRSIVTGQHDHLSLGECGFPDQPLVTLRWPRGGSPREEAERAAAPLVPLLAGAQLAIVQGDTSSALAGALAARRAEVPIAHVEAGLRSHDPRRPWPEEGFRMEIDRLSDLLFAPTELSLANLRREKIGGRMSITGNTAIDAALAYPPTAACPDDGMVRLLVTCHRRESWGAGLESIAAALCILAERPKTRITVVLHPNPGVAAQMRSLLHRCSSITLVPPLGHAALLGTMRTSSLVLTDSGGLQEEAPVFGIPLLLLRDRTERPESIASGNVVMVGTATAAIVDEVDSILADPARLERMRRPARPFGPGNAGDRIAEAVDAFLGRPRKEQAA